MTIQQLTNAIQKTNELLEKNAESRKLMQELLQRLQLELELEKRGHHWDDKIRWLHPSDLKIPIWKVPWCDGRAIIGVLLKSSGGKPMPVKFDTYYNPITHTNTKDKHEELWRKIRAGCEEQPAA